MDSRTTQGLNRWISGRGERFRMQNGTCGIAALHVCGVWKYWTVLSKRIAHEIKLFYSVKKLSAFTASKFFRPPSSKRRLHESESLRVAVPNLITRFVKNHLKHKPRKTDTVDSCTLPGGKPCSAGFEAARCWGCVDRVARGACACVDARLLRFRAVGVRAVWTVM